MQIIIITISKYIYKEVEIFSPWDVIWVVSENCKMRYLKQMCQSVSFIAHEKTYYNILFKNNSVRKYN